MGLPGGIFDDGVPLRHGGGHHNVHGGAHGYHVQIDVGALEAGPVRGGADKAALHRHLGPQSGEALDMEINGPDAAEVAAAGHGHLAVSKAAQQGADEIIGRANAPGQLIVGPGGADAGGVDLYRVAVDSTDLCPKIFQNLEAHGHIGDLGQVLDPAHAVHHEGGGDNGDGGVFRAADVHFAKQGLSTLYNILRQNLTLFSRMFFRGSRPDSQQEQFAHLMPLHTGRKKIPGSYRPRFKKRSLLKSVSNPGERCPKQEAKIPLGR